MHSRRIQAIQLKAFHLEDPDPIGFLLAQKCQLLAPDHCHRSQDAPIGFVWDWSLDLPLLGATV